MFNLLNCGLDVQASIVKANRLTDKDVRNIKAAGLRLVHRPDAPKSNVVSLDERRVMQSHTSPEAA